MKKGVFLSMLLILVTTSMFSPKISTGANFIIGPAVNATTTFYLLEKGDKSGPSRFLIIIKGAKHAISQVKIPKGISSKDALSLYSGEKSQIEYKNCETKYLGFTKRIKTSTKCTKQIVSLKKGSLEIQFSKPTTTLQPRSSLWWVVWPFVGVAGILSLALLFIARGAPAVFFVEYGFWLLLSLAVNSIIIVDINQAPTRGAGGMLISIVFLIFVYFWYLDLTGKWVKKKPELDVVSIPALLLVVFWIFLGIILVDVLFAIITPNTTIQVDFVVFIFSWLVFGAGMIMVANAFPGLAKKYLSWI